MTDYTLCNVLGHASRYEVEQAIEMRFWSIVDRDGLTGLPSDMWAALETLVNRAGLKGDAQPEVFHD